MSEKVWKRNTAGLTAHGQHRNEQKRKGVEQTLTALVREKKPVNFHTVAKAASVSKAYLYSQPDLRERIDALRQQEVEHRLFVLTVHIPWQVEKPVLLMVPFCGHQMEPEQ